MGWFDLWEEFKYDELTINMRQKTDTLCWSSVTYSSWEMCKKSTRLS
jgi:hypothetical protein